jgi:hypothetical protein
VSGAKAARHEARSPTMNKPKATLPPLDMNAMWQGEVERYIAELDAADEADVIARRELGVLEPTKLGNHRALHQRKDGLIVEIVVPGRDEDEIE